MTDSTVLATLESRLHKLERQNRLLLACLTLGIVIAAFTSAAFHAATETRSHRFVLVDSGGKEVGWWEADPDGFPRLSLGTNQKLPAFQLVQSKEGPHAVLHTGNANSHWFCEKGEARLLLNGESNSKGLSSIHLNAGKSYNIGASSQTGSVEMDATSLKFRRANASQPWFWLHGSSNSLELNGVKLKLNERNRKPIQELP